MVISRNSKTLLSRAVISRLGLPIFNENGPILQRVSTPHDNLLTHWFAEEYGKAIVTKQAWVRSLRTQNLFLWSVLLIVK